MRISGRWCQPSARMAPVDARPRRVTGAVSRLEMKFWKMPSVDERDALRGDALVVVAERPEAARDRGVGDDRDQRAAVPQLPAVVRS